MEGECLAGRANINSLALLYNQKNSASFHSGCWDVGTNSDLAFASADLGSRLPDRGVLKRSFPSHNIDHC